LLWVCNVKSFSIWHYRYDKVGVSLHDVSIKSAQVDFQKYVTWLQKNWQMVSKMDKGVLGQCSMLLKMRWYISISFSPWIDHEVSHQFVPTLSMYLV
jgi:hypothetical protein